MYIAFHSRDWKATGRTMGASLQDHSTLSPFSTILGSSTVSLIDKVGSYPDCEPDGSYHPSGRVQTDYQDPHHKAGDKPHDGDDRDLVRLPPNPDREVEGHLPAPSL